MTDQELKAKLDEMIKEAGGDVNKFRTLMRNSGIGEQMSAKQAYEIVIPTVYNSFPDIKQKMGNLTAVFQFNIEGEGGGKWHLVFTNGALEVKEGTHSSPNVTITMSEEVRKATGSGKMDPQMAFMSGKIKFAGDMALLMKLGALLR